MSNEVKKVNKLIFVDNLEVSFLGNIPTLTDSKIADVNGENKVKYYNSNCFVEFTNKSNKYFRNIADLWVEGRKIGEFRFLPTCPFIPDELINFKFENVQLYQKDFNRYIDYIIETFEFKYQYISHLDIAIDCIDHNLLKFVDNYKFYSNTDSYNTIHKGRLDKKNITTNNQNIIHWGKLDSEKYIKIYNKTLELSDTNNSKCYISICWKENKMNVEDKTVERFELTLKQKNTKKLDYKKLNDSNYLASIAYTHCLNYFQFEKSYNKNDKTYRKDVTPISFKDYNTVLLEKFKHTPTPNLYNEKRELKQLYNQYLESKFIANYQFIDTNLVPDSLKDYPGFYQTIQNVLARFPTLYVYFNSHKNNWTKEFNNKNELVRGVLSVDEYVNTIQLTQDLEFNIVEPEVNEIQIAIEDNEIVTEKQVRKSYRILELKKNQLNRTLKRIKIKTIADKSNLVEKISNPITLKIDQTNKLNSMLRKIA